MSTPNDPRTTIVTTAIRAASRYESDPDVIAARVLAALDEHTRRTHVETRTEAVRLVEDTIDAHTMKAEPSGAILISDQTATRIVDALLGRPVASITDDGVATLAWPDGTHAAIVSRDVLDNLTERVNRTAALERELAHDRARIADLERTVARLRHLGATAEDAAVESDLARLEALVVDRRPTLEPGEPDAYAHLDPLRNAVRNTIDRLEAELTSPDCKAGKCSACTGDAWSDRLDAHADCEHPCHRRVHPEGGLVPTGESGVSKSPDGTR
jgi:hypothetical protein